MEKSIEDFRKDEQHAPDLLEAIMRTTDLVKEKLRPNLFQIEQFRPKITNIRVWSKSEQLPNIFVEQP